jgi:hypothetical protein
MEDGLYYHQQYTIMDRARRAGRSTGPGDADHPADPREPTSTTSRSTDVSSEKRGRSQLYAILGWLLRFKEFANDRVLLNKMRAMFALDVTVDRRPGGRGDGRAAVRDAARPRRGARSTTTVEGRVQERQQQRGEAKTDAEMLLKIIAVGAGVSEQFLGVGRSTRAGALIQTEPDVKNFETYQEILEHVLDSGGSACSGRQALPESEAEDGV